MSQDATKAMIAEVFNDIATGIKSGQFKKKVRIGLTILGSEHGIEEMIRAAELAKVKYGDFDIVLIGTKVDADFEVVEVATAHILLIIIILLQKGTTIGLKMIFIEA